MNRKEKLKKANQTLKRMLLEAELSPAPPSGQTLDVYRIANYADGLVGKTNCESLLPRFNSGLRWGSASNPQPDTARFGGGVAGGIPWDGAFYRDPARYGAGGNLFWSAYLKPGSAAGIKGGYWLNFGSAWCHLQNDDLSQMLNGACPRIYQDGADGNWKMVIEATQYVTLAVVNVWTGSKSGGTDPVGIYTRVSGLDSAASLEIVGG